jgi:hypothetical protein
MSAPGAQVLSALGISAENVAAQIKNVIAAIA